MQYSQTHCLQNCICDENQKRAFQRKTRENEICSKPAKIRED